MTEVKLTALSIGIADTPTRAKLVAEAGPRSPASSHGHRSGCEKR